MKDVAALADVSLSTVSRFINGEPGRPELVRRIQEAIELLGYQRDLTASTLRRADRASASVGVVVADVGNPFFAAVLRGIEEVARARGSVTVAASSDEDPARERELAAALVARRIDGLIVVPAADDSGHLRTGRVPLAFVDRPPRFLDADAALSDNAGGAALATGHLVTRGHTRIGFLGDHARIFTCAERLRGYRSALGAAGLPADPALVRLDLDQGVVASAVADLLALPEPPTALVASQNLLTIGTVRALRRLGRQHRVAFVGFDDVPLADMVDPSVTVVTQQPVTLGRRAAELLFERIDGYTGPGRSVIVDTDLIVRESSEVGADTPATDV